MDSYMEKTLSSQASDWREKAGVYAPSRAQRAGLETHGDSRRSGSYGRGPKPMDQACPQEEGLEGLRRTPPPGAPPRLNQEERAKLPELLVQGAPPARGFRGEVWACERVAEVIRKEFGVSYHRAHVSRLLKKLRLSPCKNPPDGRTSGTKRP
jgi:Winged helix-turn helix